MRFGIIGYGNIGQLICENLENIGFLDKNILNVSNKTYSKLNALNPKINKYKNNIDLVKNSDIIFISVKSPDLFNLLKEIEPYINEDKFIIHSCAGVSFDEINDVFNGEISCVIPSIASQVNPLVEKTGVSIFLHNPLVSSKNKEYIENLFSKFSYITTVDNEKDLEVLTITTSCMPAFISLTTNLIAQELSKQSTLDFNDINKYLNETIFSSSNLLNLNIENNDELINKVATKGGITEKGLKYLDKEFPCLFNNLIKELEILKY